MAETSEVLPACPCPIIATFLTFSPVYTFTGSPSSEAVNLTQRKKEAQLGKAAPSLQASGASTNCGPGILVDEADTIISPKRFQDAGCRRLNLRAMLETQCSG